MPAFRCPSCGRNSNKFVIKCPDCGYTRGVGKEISTDNESAKTNRELRRDRRIAGNKFRGGRNKGFVGTGRKQYPIKGNR